MTIKCLFHLEFQGESSFHNFKIIMTSS